MIFNGHKELITQEYSRNSVVTRGMHLIPINGQSILSFSGWKMAIALARTLCSNHLDIKEFYYDFISSIFSLSLIVHRPMNNFRLRSNRLNRLRDFSRTNKIGELGQAAVWLYLMENGYPYINDFDFFCNQNGIVVPANSSTPDFVAQNSATSINLCLAESKAKETVSTTRLKSNLKDGLNQCDSGESLINGNGNTHFNIVKKLAFCTEFSDENNQTNSQLNFSDPENINDILDTNDLPLRIHYASWFYIIGDFDNVMNLINRKPIEFNEKRFQKRNINGVDFWTIKIFDILIDTYERHFMELFKWFYHPYIFKCEDVKLGISDNVIKYLKNTDYAMEIEKYKSESKNNYEIFVDGTIIVDIPKYEGERSYS